METRIREGSFAVIGLGTFGGQTARALYRGGAIVLAIDRDEKLVEQISPVVTVAVRADATHEETLREVGAFDMSTAIVAIRRQFDTTVLVTHLLHKNEVPEILVQVDSEQEESAIKAVGATSVIFPERDMADQIARRLLTPGLADQVPLGENVAIIDVPCPKTFAGKTLEDLQVRRKYHVTIVAVKTPTSKGHHTFEIAPPADQKLAPHQHLVVLGDRKKLYSFKQQLNIDEENGEANAGNEKVQEALLVKPGAAPPEKPAANGKA
jgi:trk system potassium uptake protein